MSDFGLSYLNTSKCVLKKNLIKTASNSSVNTTAAANIKVHVGKVPPASQNHIYIRKASIDNKRNNNCCKAQNIHQNNTTWVLQLASGT